MKSLIKLYIIIDDFVKEFQRTKYWELLKHIWSGKRGPKKKLELSEVMTLNLFRYYLRIKDLKTFYAFVKNNCLEYFPCLPNYENFLKATNRSGIFIYLFLRYLLALNKAKSRQKEHFVDSTPISVCLNHNIFTHKVAKRIAARGFTTKGWFYGLKLHGVCNQKGELENIYFTPGNVYDNQVLEDLVEDIFGTIVGDAGYLLKGKDLEKIFKDNRILNIAPRKNMKRLMTERQEKLFKARSIIETTWSVLKERFLLVYHLARSIHGLFRHYFYSIASFLLSKIANSFQLPLVAEAQP